MKCVGKILKFILTGFVALSVTSCSDSTDEGSEEFRRLNGEKPEVYYSQFLYQPEGGGTYRYLRDDSAVSLQSVSAKKHVRGNLSLFLLGDRTYTAVYQEALVCTVGSIWAGIPISHQVIEGKWSLQGTSLVLENVGRGHGVKVNETESLSFQFEKHVTAAGATQKVFILKMTQSTSSWEHERTRQVKTMTLEQASAELDHMDVNCRD